MQPDLTTPSATVIKTSYIYTDTPKNVSIQKTDYLDPLNSVTNYTYFDGLGRKIQEKKQAEAGNYETKDYLYNNLGLLDKESLPYFSFISGRTAPTSTSSLYTNYIYDPRQRVTQTTNSLGTTTNTFSDWKLTVTDPNGKTKDLSKDAYGNLMQVDEHNAGNIYSTHYAYDYLGDLTNITDAMGNIRNFTYDGLGRRLTAEDLHNPSDSSFGTWSYTYDDAGNLTRTLDPKSQTINYTYDALNRKLTEDFTGTPGVEVTNTYDIGTDGIGHLTGIVTSALTQTNSYNPLGGLKSESKVINGKTFTTNYDYDIQGNQILITNPDGSQVKNIYNEAGLLNQTRRKESTDSDFSDVVSNYDYSPTEQTTVIDYANGSVTTNTYEATKLYRLASKVTTIAAGDHAQDLSYTYDAIGNITQIIDASNTDTSKTANYTYDDLNRLTQATITNVAVDQQPYTQAFTYDAIGNILTRTETNGADAPITYTYIYNGNIGTSYANPHAVTSINDGTNTILYTYDNNGNELTKGTDKIMSLTNTWDYNNRLITADTGTNTDVYTYDASGERIMTENTKHNISPVLTTVHIESNNQDPTLAKVGDTVTLSFNSSVSLTLPKVTIVGHDATVSGTGPYTSSYILTGDDNAGKISFTIDFADASGNKGTEVTATSDSSVVNFDNPTVDPTPPPAPAPIPPDPAPSPSPDAAPAGNPNATTILSALTFAGGTNGAAAIAKLAIPAALTANASDHSITIDGVTIDLGTLALSPVEIAAKISATDFSIGTSYVADGAYTVTNDGVDTLTFTRTTSGLTGNATLAISDANYTTTNDVVPPPPTPDPTPPDPSLVPASDPVPAPLPDPAPIPPPDPVPVPPAPTPSTPNLVPNILNLNDITTLDLSAGLIPQTPIDVNAEGVTTTMVKSVVLNAETTGDPVVISNSDLPDVTLTIPDGTNIQGPELWDGNIIPPKTNTSGFQLADKIIQVGSPGNILVLDKPAMITISNSLGPVVYQTADGAASVTLPTCDGTYDAPTAPAIPNACSISNDTGTKILTYHFSTFDVSQDTTVTTIYPSNLYNIASSGSGSSTDGTKQTKQIYGSGQLTATVETVGGVVSPYYVHADHLGSTNVISDSADANVKVMDYYPFGTNRVSSGTFDPQRQYIGQLHDDDTGLDYLNARYYDGKSGQFISQDSLFWEIGQSKNGKGLLLSPQLQNSYAYSGNNPILNKDPSGKCIEDLCISEAIAFTELATQYAPQINSFLQSLTSSLGQFGLSQAGEDAHKGNFAMAAIDLAGSGEGSEVKTASEEAGTMLYRSMQEGIDGMPVLGESATTLGARIGPELDIATDENGIVHPNSGGMSVNTNPNNIPEYRRPSEFGGTGKNPMWCLGTCSLPKGLKFTLEEAKNPLNTHGFTEPAKSMGGKAFNQLIQSTKSLWKKI
jgi:RHS repeat-associated protein